LTACSAPETENANACISKLKNELLSPSSAKFSRLKLTYLDKKHFAIQGNVDAKNTFGTSLRSVFVCEGTNQKDVRVVYLSGN
jgi:hypothetical protein